MTKTIIQGIQQRPFQRTGNQVEHKEANDTFAEFVRTKIRARVKDPVVAEKLVPKDHPFGTKRVPLESGYYILLKAES